MMDPEVSERYNQKINDYCGGVDPYSLSLKTAKDSLPGNVHYFDICNYCIEKDSSYTLQSFKSYKSLDAFKLYESGWVQSVLCKHISTGSILLARVKHSYRVHLTPLKCWVSVNKDGVVLSGHCNCMAGLGEVCSHVAAVLFLLEDWGRRSKDIANVNPESISCTDVLCKWLVPATKDVEMASIEEIEWGNEKGNVEDTSILSVDSITNINSFFNDSLNEEEAGNVEQSEEAGLTEDEVDTFLKKIHEQGVFCPIMAVREQFSKYFIQKSSEELLLELPLDEDHTNYDVISLFVPSLFKPAYENLSIDELREIANDIHLSYTQDEIEFIEKKTMDQISCTLWYRFRAGRVTGSVFKKVCRTSIISPAFSTIEQICFPERKIFRSEPTDYGIQNESVARDTYADAMRQIHKNFNIKLSGLIINNNYPFCGASPDAITSCECCGTGTVEIKCPWLLKNGKLDAYLKRRECPLLVVEGDDLPFKFTYKLKVDHEYYYQVQMQIFLTNSEFCDFVVWQPSQSITVRVYKDDPFWQKYYPKASEFFHKVLLPEILGNYYSRLRTSIKK